MNACKYTGEDMLARAAHLACQWEDNKPPPREQEVIDMLTQAGTDLLRSDRPSDAPLLVATNYVVPDEWRNPPKWYSRFDIFSALRHMKYSEQIANELADWWALHFQLAFNKGWQKCIDHHAKGAWQNIVYVAPDPSLLDALRMCFDALKHAKPQMAHYPEPVERHRVAMEAAQSAIERISNPTARP